MSHLTLNVALAIYDSIAAVAMLVIMQLSTAAAGWRGPSARHALVRRVVHFLIALALGYRVYTLLEAKFEISVPSFITALVLTGGVVALSAMRLLWPSTKLSPKAVGYTARPEGVSHCADCFFFNREKCDCRLVDVTPVAAGHCDLILNIDAEIQARAAGGASSKR